MIELTKDVAIVITELYSSIKRSNPESADLFKFAIEELVNDEKTPLWDVKEVKR